MPSDRHGQKSNFGIVAIAASAGGVTAIRNVLSGLPSDFPVPILCLQHLNPFDTNVLAQVLQLRTHLTVRWAYGGEQLKASVVYVCPPGHYFVVHANGTISLAQQAIKHGWHHGVNNFFESVAQSYADRAVVVVLTGTGKGGEDGVQAVSKMGGIVLAQEPASSVADGMPQVAIATGCVNRVLPCAEIPPLLVRLVYEGCSLSQIPNNYANLFTTQEQISPILEDALSSLLDRAITMHRTDMGYIHLFKRQSCTLELAVQRGFKASSFDYFRTVNITDNSPCISVVRTGESIIVEDIETDPIFSSHRAIALAAGYRAVQSIPLTSDKGNLLGVLSTHFRQPRQFLPWEMKLLNMHARHAGNIIEIFQTDTAT
ncbi:chemotaxis protein CheB [Nostoc piscinale]|uniref:chemotaxis protein CheB n=1 Tax=Nostoc piscinale TaxID=224012 RepID=UPI00078169F4|nr:chemotaxis protein CheB [Nostoc piscinale]